MTKSSPTRSVPATAVGSPSAVVVELAQVLADTYALAVKTHGAHWNVRGVGFFRLHAVFEEQYTELFLAADEVAERIRALGVDAPSSIRHLSEISSLPESAMGDDSTMVRSLRDDHRRISARARKAVAAAQDGDDEGTADLLIGRSKAHDKTAWMLSATLGE